MLDVRLEIDVYEDSEGLWGYHLYKITPVDFSDISVPVYEKSLLTERDGFIGGREACIDSAHKWLAVTDLAVKFRSGESGSFVNDGKSVKHDGVGSEDVASSNRLPSRLSSLKELELRLEAQDDRELWNDLASIWYIQDDDDDLIIMGYMANIDSCRVELSPADIDSLSVEFGEFSELLREGLYYMYGFRVFSEKRVYTTYTMDGVRTVVCADRNPE